MDNTSSLICNKCWHGQEIDVYETYKTKGADEAVLTLQFRKWQWLLNLLIANHARSTTVRFIMQQFQVSVSEALDLYEAYLDVHKTRNPESYSEPM